MKKQALQKSGKPKLNVSLIVYITMWPKNGVILKGVLTLPVPISDAEKKGLQHLHKTF